MATRRPLTQFVESYRFRDVATLWGRERLEHEDIVARTLARAVICELALPAFWFGTLVSRGR